MNITNSIAMSMSAEYYLGVDILILTIQLFSLFGNGFIVWLFFRTNKLYDNQALRLILLLCVTDFVFAVTALPYIIYYIVLWNPVLFDYSPMFMVTSSIPLVVQFKLNLIITIAIAVDRLQAMKAMVYYRKKNHMFHVWMTLLIGVALGAIDVVLEYMTTIFDVHRYNCAAIGCFQEFNFRAYWGISNMALNVVALILTLWVAVELNGFQTSMQGRELNQLKQANRLSAGILIISMIFLLVPSTFVGIIELFHLDIFRKFGPFYIVGLLLAGASNSVIYITQHVEIRHAVRKVFGSRVASLSQATSNIPKDMISKTMPTKTTKATTINALKTYAS